MSIGNTQKGPERKRDGIVQGIKVLKRLGEGLILGELFFNFFHYDTKVLGFLSGYGCVGSFSNTGLMSSSPVFNVAMIGI